ncbi:uncharacterized protein LOC134042820 [Cinclus cinclus]|uniref:uncharacterized protein LOC134042820 n=1 Tax=Cinclus cinclus TaxID=127875 RepID=UPI002E127CF7
MGFGVGFMQATSIVANVRGLLLASLNKDGEITSYHSQYGYSVVTRRTFYIGQQKRRGKEDPHSLSTALPARDDDTDPSSAILRGVSNRPDTGYGLSGAADALEPGGHQQATAGGAVRTERPLDVCGDGRGVAGLGPGVSTCSRSSGLSRPAAPSRGGRSSRVGAVPGARDSPLPGASSAGERDAAEKGAGPCSGPWNLRKCFPNVFAEIQLWGSCKGASPDGAPAEDGAIAAPWHCRGIRDLWYGSGAPAGARASSSKRQSCNIFLARDCLHAGKIKKEKVFFVMH